MEIRCICQRLHSDIYKQFSTSFEFVPMFSSLFSPKWYCRELLLSIYIYISFQIETSIFDEFISKILNRCWTFQFHVNFKNKSCHKNNHEHGHSLDRLKLLKIKIFSVKLVENAQIFANDYANRVVPSRF